jgi:hypothetical protein
MWPPFVMFAKVAETRHVFASLPNIFQPSGFFIRVESVNKPLRLGPDEGKASNLVLVILGKWQTEQRCKNNDSPECFRTSCMVHILFKPSVSTMDVPHGSVSSALA